MMTNAQAMKLVRQIDKLLEEAKIAIERESDPQDSMDLECLGHDLLATAKQLRKLEDRMDKHDRQVRKMVGRG